MQKTTRVNELVRYDMKRAFSDDACPIMESDDKGEFVRYDQAAAMLKKRENRYDTLWLNYTALDKAMATEMRKRKAAEAELAQIKAQVPLLYTDETSLKLLSDHWPSVKVIGADKEQTGSSKRPLYAAPVDQTAEIERLREAMTAALLTMQRYKRMGYGDEVYMADLCESIRTAESALSGKEPS